MVEYDVQKIWRRYTKYIVKCNERWRGTSEGEIRKTRQYQKYIII
jgi:hypothetical protein